MHTIVTACPKPKIIFLQVAQGSKLTFSFRNQLATNGNILVPNLFYIYITQENDFIRYSACKKSHNRRAKVIGNNTSNSYKATDVLSDMSLV